MNDETAVLPAVPTESRDAPSRRDGRSSRPSSGLAGGGERDSLATELAAAAPQRWWNKGTIALGAAALLLGGFLGGVQANRQWGTDTAATAGRPAGFTGGGQNRGGGGMPAPGPGGAAPRPSAAASGTDGTVKLVNGSTIYVQTADGSIVTVKTSGETTVSTAKQGKLSDVRAGDTVTVQGTAGADGTVTATAVTARKK